MILSDCAQRSTLRRWFFVPASGMIFHKLRLAVFDPRSRVSRDDFWTAKRIDGSLIGARRAWGHGSRVLNCERGDTRLRVDLVKETKKTFKRVCCPIYVYLFVSSPGVARRRVRAEDTVPRKSRRATPTSVVDFLFLRHYFIYSEPPPPPIRARILPRWGDAGSRRGGARISNISAN